MMDRKPKPVFEVAGIKVDPCCFALSVALTIAAWEGDAHATAEEVKAMMGGVTCRCVCGNTQPANLVEVLPVSRAVQEFEDHLKPRNRIPGSKRITPSERKKLRTVLLNALREAATLESNTQKCSRCGHGFLLSTSDD